jgi:hypothetical protein
VPFSLYQPLTSFDPAPVTRKAAPTGAATADDMIEADQTNRK